MLLALRIYISATEIIYLRKSLFIRSNIRYTSCNRKGEHDSALEQYRNTIGQLEPSYVIRKVRH